MFRCSELPLATRYQAFHDADPSRSFFRTPWHARRYLVIVRLEQAAKCLWLRKINGDRRQKYRRALSVAECGGVPNKIREVKVTQVVVHLMLQMPRSICSAKCVSTLTINEIYFTEIYPYLIHVLRTTARKKTHHREHDVNDSIARRRKRDTSPLPGFLSSRRSVSRARPIELPRIFRDPFRSYATEGDAGRRSFWIVLKWVVAREVSQLCPERDALTNQLPWGSFSSPSGSSSDIFRLSQTQIFPRSRHLPSALSAYTSPLAFVCVCGCVYTNSLIRVHYAPLFERRHARHEAFAVLELIRSVLQVMGKRHENGLARLTRELPARDVNPFRNAKTGPSEKEGPRVHALLQLFIYRIYHSSSKCKQIHVKDVTSLSMTTSLIGLKKISFTQRRELYVCVLCVDIYSGGIPVYFVNERELCYSLEGEVWDGPIKETCWTSLRVMTLTTYIKVKIIGGDSPKQNLLI
ncbi:hypothetical protein G5I_12683 [Acromyrmex echinatior]|uniref:Uncharacterized protein n=1 Tax=Acromyrmex echinatior TaxID=103372 RepID=F4X2Z8_ACREC|nr:hypothetical protein G5I_12683 [Acromyrmex echinatior]